MSVPKPFIVAAVAASLTVATPFIGSWEGRKNTPYKDVVGIPTVCYGETRVQMRKYTNEECLIMLNDSTEEFAEGVLSVNPQLVNRPLQLAAATSLAYNIGISAYKKSTVARRFNEGRYKEACEAFRMWNKAGGRVVQGLVNRREAEYKLCVTYL